MLGQAGVVVLDKKRFLIIPSDNLQDATVVSADEQTGLRVSQATANTSVGGLNITLSGEPEAEISGQACISRAGLADDARFTFVRDGDDLTTDVQFEQSPLVFGARTDLIDTSTSTYKILPKALALANGDLFVGWLNSVYKPSDFALKRDTWGGFSSAILQTAVCSKETGDWTQYGAADIYSGDDVLNDYNLISFDFVQHPDTDLITMVTVWHSITYETLLVTFESSDNGQSWKYRSLRSDQVDTPVVFDAVSCAMERMPSGRLVLAVASMRQVLTFVSDDRGGSWLGSTLITFDNAGGVNADFISVSMTIARNGVPVLFVNHPRLDTVSLPAPGNTPGDITRAPLQSRVYVSLDGESWGGGLFPTSGTPGSTGDNGVLHGTVTQRPDGRLCFMGQVFSTDNTTVVNEKDHWNYLVQRVSPVFDPSPANTPASLLPDPTGPFWPVLHAFQTTAHVASGNTLRFSQGFLGGLDSVLWRGKMVVIQSVIEEDLTKTPGDASSLLRGSLSLHQTRYLTAIQERLGTAYQQALPATEGPSSVFDYGRTYWGNWDCFTEPDLWNYTKVVGGTGSSTLVTTDNGALGINAGIGDTLDYRKNNLLLGKAGGMVRIVVKGHDGGDTATGDVRVHWALSDGVNSYGFDVVFAADSGSGAMGIVVYDYPGGATQIGGLTTTADTWIEVLLCMTPDALGDIYGAVFARPLVGPDYLDVWESVVPSVKLLSVVALTEKLTWGVVSATASTDFSWKSVHFHRNAKLPLNGENIATIALQQHSFPFVEDEVAALTSQVAFGVGFITYRSLFEPEVDAGQDSFMRTPRVPSTPRWLDKGVYLSGAGLATTTGVMDYSSEYAQGARNVLQHPVLKEWRGEDTQGLTKSPEVSMVFSNLKNMRPDALALFGRNTPRIRIQLNDTDVWTSPSVDFVVTDPNFAVAAPTGDQEYGHLWYSDSSAATIFPGSYKIGVANASPWRKHQFRSQETGQKFYVSVPAKALTLPVFPFGDHVVYRIKDNTENTLILEHDISQDFNFTDFEFSIFSDRVAFSIEDLVGQEFLDSVTTGYDYLKITFEACWHRDADEGFHRLGRLLLGDLADLSGPDFNWDWSRGIQANNTLTQSPAGPSFSNRRGQFKRSFTASKGLMRAAEVAGMEETPLNVTEGSWEEFLNLVERLEVNGQECALLWQGERAVAGSNDGLRTADPLELMMVRLASVGAVTQQQYSCQGMQLPSSASEVSVARPWMAVAAIDFREEF